MPVYKFYYFDARAHGELCRLVFGATGTEFEDIRITGSQWLSWKPKLVTHKLPMLSVDGTEIFQSRTIARYLAREFGLAGSTNTEQAFVEQIVDICDDLYIEHAKEYHEKDETKREEVKRKARETLFPEYVSVILKLREQHGEDGFTVGNKLTLADLAIFDVMTYYQMNYPDILDNFQEIKAILSKLEEQNHLKDYLNSRPKTKY